MSAKRWLIFLVVLVFIFATPEAKSQTIELTTFQERWAILVGVGAYPEDSGIPPLEHPKDDVQKLREILITRGAFKPSHIEILTDDQATREGLESAFKNFRKDVKPSDLLIFYFSGRGARVQSGLYADTEQDGLNECLLLYDSTRKVEENFFRDAELGQLLGSLKAKRIVIIIDACYSASDNRAKAITTAADSDATSVQRDGIINDYMPRGKTVILEACTPDVETFDGVFTQRLIETLRDDTAHGADGIITLEETQKSLQMVLSNQRPQLKKTGVLRAISLIQPLVTISSNPSGAEVFVDNTQLLDETKQPVTTLVSIALPIGEHQINLQKWGYISPEPISIKVDAPGKQKPVHRTLKPASIKGKLVYQNSGKPVVDANVWLEPLGYETTTNKRGEFSFDDWEQYKIYPGVEYQVQIRDEKNRVPFREESFKPEEFYEEKTISTFRLPNLAAEQQSVLPRNVMIVIIILVGATAAMVWFWKIRPERIAAYREQHYPIWENEISTRLRTSGKTDFDWIQRKHQLYVQNRYIREHFDTKLVGGSRRIIYKMRRSLYISYKVEIAERVADFDKHWKTALANLSDDTSEQLDAFREAIKSVTDILCRALEFEREDMESDFDRLYGHLVNAPTLQLNLPNTFPFIYIQRDEPTDDDLDALIDLMRKLNVIQRFAFVIIFSNSRRVQEKLFDKGLRPSYDFIVLDEDNLRDILIEEDARNFAIKTMLLQVELTVVSPYVIYGPTPPNVFFGRDWEIKTILRTLQQHNIALPGGRQIGKTSILHRVRDILLRSERAVEYGIAKEEIELSPLYLNCQAAPNYESFLRYAARQWRADEPLNSLIDFYELASRKREEYKTRLVILIDDADGILKYDSEHENQLFGIFRMLSEGDICRFVFTGERIVHNAILNENSVLSNFCQPLHVGYLDEKSAARLVSKPMKDINIQLEDEENIIHRILDLTSCHPRMVQWVCFELLKIINREGTRTITMAHLKEMENSRDFQSEFINTIWGGRIAFEKLVSLLIVEADAPMSAEKIGDKLKENGLNASELDTTLEILKLASVLTEEKGHYRFLANEFPRIFRANINTKDFIERLKEEISNEQS